MRVFITGASGWIGSATTDELLAHGHQVVALARSEESAAALEAKGVEVLRGDLDDLDSLRAGAAAAEGVIHYANKHDFNDMANSNRAERGAVQTFADALAGTDRPLIIASGVANPIGRPLTERDESPHVGPDSMRGGAERLALDYADKGVRSIAIRFAPTVHGVGDHGFVAYLAHVAREKGVSGYIGDGANRWPAVHVTDAARLTRLALESAPAGSVLHGVAEEGVPTREIAEGLGRAAGVPVTSIAPEEAASHFGWIAHFFGIDAPASNALTRELLGWEPIGPSLADDLPHY